MKKQKPMLDIASFEKDWEDWTKPISFYEKIIKKLSNPITIQDKALLVLSYYKKFILLNCNYGYNDLSKALKYLEIIIVDYPNEKIFYIVIATIYENLLDYHNALIYCDKALCIDPNCIEALYKKYKILYFTSGKLSISIMKKLQTICPMYNANSNSLKKKIQKFTSKKGDIK